MKNIKDIMKDMNNIGQQITETINNELEADEELETDEKLTENLEVKVQRHPSCSANHSTTCAAIDSNSREIPFCFSIAIPGNFIPNTSVSPKILIDPSCLKAIVDPCSCNGIPRWDIRIIGSIPFIINISIDNSGACAYPSDSNISACYSNSTSVDRVIGSKCIYEDAIISRSKITFNSSTLSVSPISQTFNKGEYFVKVTGAFILPDCP